MPKAKIETVEIASANGRGNYNFPWEIRLVRRGEKYYVLNDEWCGEGQVRGETYRPFVYEATEGEAKATQEALENFHDDHPRYEFATYGEIWQEDVFPLLRPLGEKGRLSWTKNL